jgi:hypothetical protein
MLKQWVEECCDVRLTLWDTSKNLFASYSDWMAERGESPGKQKALTQALKRIPGITKVDTKQARGLKGIRLRANVEI